MKNISKLIIGLSILMFGTTAYSQSRTDNSKEVPAVQSGTKSVQIASSPELHNLATNWVNDYNESNPAMKILLIQSNDEKAVNHLSLISDEHSIGLNDQNNWRMVIGRDVIVPIINAKNPMLDLLHQQGISSKEFAFLFKNVEQRNWSAVVTNGQNARLQLFIPNDEIVNASLRDFANVAINAKSEKFQETANDVLAEVQKDIFAIGFCKLSDLRNLSNRITLGNIALLPIDKNGNGRIDNFERIYNSLDEFTNGVWIGKYPTSLSKNIYAVSAIKPTDQNELAFLTWILSGGQNLLKSNGYCDLTSGEKQSNIASLLGTVSTDGKDVNVAYSPKYSWPIVVVIFLILGIFSIFFYYSRRNSKSQLLDKEIQIAPLLIENVINIPKGLYFDKTHTWAFMEQDGNVRVGLDDFLQHVTGKLSKISMKDAGEVVRKGEVIMTIIHEGKKLNIYAPISGTILEQNDLLLTDSSLVNSSPFFKGWVYQIEPKNWLREVQFMFMGQKYIDWLQDEFIRLKDFISATVKIDKLAYAHVILQDGGELTDNVLADLEPEVWEDFQTQFIDTSR